jgi:hypothetical protein
MKYLNVQIDDKIARYQLRDGVIVCDNKNEYTIKFTFDEEWDAHPKKYAHFVWNGQYFDQEFTGDECPVLKIIDATELFVGVYAGDQTTTTDAVIPCRKSSLSRPATPSTANDGHYANQAKADADRAEAAADRAAEEAVAAVGPAAAKVLAEVGVVQSTGTSVSAVMSQAAVTDAVSRNSKRIANLEAGLPAEDFVTDSSTAYRRDVPANALPFAEVSEIGGMTYKEGNVLRSAPVTEVVSVGVNLIPYPYAETTKTLNGVTWTVNSDGGITASGTPTGYTALVLNSSIDIRGYTTFTVSMQGSFSNITVDAAVFDASGNVLTTSQSVNFVFNRANYPTAAILSINIKRVVDGIPCSGEAYVMLNKNTAALPYRPYIRRTLPIPEAVQPAHGIPNTDCYDRIRWLYDEQAGKWVRESEKRLGVVDLGTLDWIYGIWGSDMVFSSLTLTDIKQNTNAVVCTIPFVKANEVYNAIVDNSFTVNVQAIRGRFSNYTDVASFKSAMSGVMLVYELATPEVTDISHLLPEDNLIGVEGGGSMTPVNEYGYAVPAKITYQIEEA